MQTTSTSRSETPKLRGLSRSSSFSSTTGSIKHDTRVQVFVRARPPEDIYETDSSLEFPSNREIKLTDPKQETIFKFDHVFPPSITNQEVCDYICSPLINSVLEGYNGSFMVYGQTGSGKTFTVQAEDGLISTTITQLFSRINEDQDHNYKVYLSYLQIYHERIYDLLDPSKETDLHLREHPDEGVIVEGLSELNIKTTQDAEELLQFGRRQLVVAETRMVRLSSRSHSLCIIRVDKSKRIRELETPLPIEDEMVLDPLLFKGAEAFLKGKLYLCDLAGSERLKKSGVTGDRLKEARYINSSLLELGNVIHALSAAKSQHVPFRNSTLTRILKESLGGNSRASLMICVSSSIQHISETKCSLNFGQRALRVTKSSSPNVEQFAQAYPIMKPRATTMLYPKIDYKALSEYLSKKLKELEMAYQQEKQGFKKMKEDMKTARKGSSKIPVFAARRTSTITKEPSSHTKDMETAHDEVFTDATTSGKPSDKESKQAKGTRRRESVESKNIPEKQERKRKQSRLPRIKKPSLPSFSSDNEEQSPMATVAKTKVDMETCTDDDLELMTREMILDEIQLIKSYSSMSCQTDENANYVMADGSNFESDISKSHMMKSDMMTRDIMTSGTMTDDMMTSEWSQLPLIASVLSDDISNDMPNKLSTAQFAQFTSARKSSFSDNIEKQFGELLVRGNTQNLTSQTGAKEIDEITSTRKSLSPETQTSFIQRDNIENKPGEFFDRGNKQAVTSQIVASQTDQIIEANKDYSRTAKHIGPIQYSSQHQGIETVDSNVRNQKSHEIAGDEASIVSTAGSDSCHGAQEDSSYGSKEVLNQSSLSESRPEKYDINSTKDDTIATSEAHEKTSNIGNLEESFAHRQNLDGRSESEQRYDNDQIRLTGVSMEREVMEEKPIYEIAHENIGHKETTEKRDNISNQGESDQISADATEAFEREGRVDISHESTGSRDTTMDSKKLSQSLEHTADDQTLRNKISADFEETVKKKDGGNVSEKGRKGVMKPKTNIPKMVQRSESKDRVGSAAVAKKVKDGKSGVVHEVPQREYGVSLPRESKESEESIIDNENLSQSSEYSGRLEKTGDAQILCDTVPADTGQSFQTKGGVVASHKGKESRESPTDSTEISQSSAFKARLENREDELLQREVGTAGVTESGEIETDGRKQTSEDMNHLQMGTACLTKVEETISEAHSEIMGGKGLHEEDMDRMDRVDLKTHSSMKDGLNESSASREGERKTRGECLTKSISTKGRVNEQVAFGVEPALHKGEHKNSDSSKKKEVNEMAPFVGTEGTEDKGMNIIDKPCLKTLPNEVGQTGDILNAGKPMKVEDAVKLDRSDAMKHKDIHETVLPRPHEQRHELRQNKDVVEQDRKRHEDGIRPSDFQTGDQELQMVDREGNIIESLILEENAKILSSLERDSSLQSQSPLDSESSFSKISPMAAETSKFRDAIDGSNRQDDLPKIIKKQETNSNSIQSASHGVQAMQEQRLNKTSSRPVSDGDVSESSPAMNSKMYVKEALLDDNEMCTIMETKSLTETKASPDQNSQQIPDSKLKTAEIEDPPASITNNNVLSNKAVAEMRDENREGKLGEKATTETWPQLSAKETNIGYMSDENIAQKSKTERELREAPPSDSVVMSSRPDAAKSNQVAHSRNVVEEEIPTCIEAGSQESQMRFEEIFSRDEKEDKKVVGAIKDSERETTFNKNRTTYDKMPLENISGSDGRILKETEREMTFNKNRATDDKIPLENLSGSDGRILKETERGTFSEIGEKDYRKKDTEATDKRRNTLVEKCDYIAEDDRPKIESQGTRGVIDTMSAIKQEKNDDKINNNETSDYVVIWDDIEGHEKLENVTFEQKTVSEYVIVDKNSNEEIHCAQVESSSTSRANDGGSRYSSSGKEKILSFEGGDEADGTGIRSKRSADAINVRQGSNLPGGRDELEDTKITELTGTKLTSGYDGHYENSGNNDNVESVARSAEHAEDKKQLIGNIENLQTNIASTDKKSSHSTVMDPKVKLRATQGSEGATMSLEVRHSKDPTALPKEGMSAYARSDKVLARSESQVAKEQTRTTENSNAKMEPNKQIDTRKDIDIKLPAGQGMVSEVVPLETELSGSEHGVEYLETKAVRSKSKDEATTDRTSSTSRESLKADPTNTVEKNKHDRSQRSSLGQESIRRVSLTAVSSLSQFKEDMTAVASEPDEGIADKEVEGNAISKNAHCSSYTKVDDATDGETQLSHQSLMSVEKKIEMESHETFVTEPNAQGLVKVPPKAKRRLVCESENRELLEAASTLPRGVSGEEEFVEEKAIRETNQRKGITNEGEHLKGDISEQLQDLEREQHISQAERGTGGEYLHDVSKTGEHGVENQQSLAKVEVKGQRGQVERSTHAAQRQSTHKEEDAITKRLKQLDDIGKETQIRQQESETGRECRVQVRKKERGTENQRVQQSAKGERPAMGQQSEVQRPEKRHKESLTRTSLGALVKDSDEAGLGGKEAGTTREEVEIPPLPKKQNVGQRKRLGERKTENERMQQDGKGERPAMGQQSEVQRPEKRHEESLTRTSFGAIVKDSEEAGLGGKEAGTGEEVEIPPLPRKQNVGQRKRLGEGRVTKEGTVSKQEDEKGGKKVVRQIRESDKNETNDLVRKNLKKQSSIEETEELVLGLLTIGSDRGDFASTKMIDPQMERGTRGTSKRLLVEQDNENHNNEYKMVDSCIGKERPVEVKEAVIVDNEERMRKVSIGEARIISSKPKAVQFKEIEDYGIGLSVKQDGHEVRRVVEGRDSPKSTSRDATGLLAIAPDTRRSAAGRIRGSSSSSQDRGNHLAPLQIYTHSLNDSMSYSEQSSVSPTPSATSTESEFTVAVKEKDKLKKALSTVKNQYEGLLQEFDKIISNNGAESGDENVQISKETYQVALQCKEELEMEITKAREQLAFVVATHDDQSDSSLFWQSSEYEFSEDSESFTDRSFDITDESGGFPRGMSTPVPPITKGTKRDSSTQSGSMGEGTKDIQTSTRNENLLAVVKSDVRKRPTPEVQERATNTSPESESDSKYRRSPRYARPGYDSFNEADEELGFIPIPDLQRLPATLPRRRGPKRRHRGMMLTEEMDPNEANWVSRKSLVNKEQAKRNEKLTLQAIENAELKKELLLTKLEKIRLEAMLSCVMMRVSPTEVDQGFRQMSVNSITSSTSTLRSTSSLTNITQNDPGNPFQPTSPFRRLNARQAPSMSGSESGRTTQQRVRFEEMRKTPSSTLSPRSSSLFCHSSLLTQSSLSPSSIDFDMSSCTSSDFRSTPVPMERVSPCGQDGDENIISPSTNKGKADGQTTEEEIEIAYKGKGKMNLGSCLPFRKKKKSPKKSSKKYKERSQSETSMDDSYGADC